MSKQLRVTAASLTKQRKEGRSWDYIARKYSVRKDTMLKYARSKGVDTAKRYKPKPVRKPRPKKTSKSESLKFEFYQSKTIGPLKAIYQARKRDVYSAQVRLSYHLTIFCSGGGIKYPDTQPFFGLPTTTITAASAKENFNRQLSDFLIYICDPYYVKRYTLKDKMYHMILRTRR